MENFIFCAVTTHWECSRLGYTRKCWAYSKNDFLTWTWRILCHIVNFLFPLIVLKTEPTGIEKFQAKYHTIYRWMNSLWRSSLFCYTWPMHSQTCKKVKRMAKVWLSLLFYSTLKAFVEAMKVYHTSKINGFTLIFVLTIFIRVFTQMVKNVRAQN